MSIDVEDWFQVENLKGVIARGTWDSRELRVERNTDRMLELMAARGIRCTSFNLGWVADKCPALIKRIADAGHESRKLARQLMQDNGWKLQIVKRKQRAFKVAGLTWIVERTFAWIGRNRRFSKDYEYCMQTSETMIDIATVRLILNRIVPT